MHPQTAARSTARRQLVLLHKVASRLRREFYGRLTGTADIVGVRRRFDGLSLTVATPSRRDGLRAMLVAPEMRRAGGIGLPLERIDRDFATVTIDAGLLAATARPHSRLELRGRVRRWRLGRSDAVGRPPVTMPASPMTVTVDRIVTARLASSRGEAILHHVSWSA